MPKPQLADTVPQNLPWGPHLSSAMFYILLSLADGQKHGYGIMREVEQRQAVVLGPGTLYGAIKRMLEAGLIGEAEERPDPRLDDQRRRYYRLTPAGHAAAVAEATRLEGLVSQARAKQLLPGPRPEPSST
ncbi:MAG TPA: PadR family transcriptional regulator [Anaerolineales bacterium]